jgi:hypothetical protein
MGPQKPTVSFRVRSELREEIKAAYYKEASPDVESAAAFMEQLLEYAWMQYQSAGSLRKLLPLQVLNNLKSSLVNERDNVVSSLSAQGKSHLRKNAQKTLTLALEAKDHAQRRPGRKQLKTGSDK